MYASCDGNPRPSRWWKIQEGVRWGKERRARLWDCAKDGEPGSGDGCWAVSCAAVAGIYSDLSWSYYRFAMTLVIEQDELDRLPVDVDPEILGGQPVFRGTRVPVDALLENLEAGLSLEEFLENFPTVTRAQAVSLLEFSRTTLRRLGGKH